MPFLPSGMLARRIDHDHHSSSHDGITVAMHDDHDRPHARKVNPYTMQDLKADVWCIFLVSVFTIIAPIVTFGWLYLSFHGIALFLAVYIFTQNLPNFFNVALFESWIASKGFSYMKEYLAPCRVIMTEELDPEKKYIIGWHPHGRVFVGIGLLMGCMFDWLPQFKKASRMVHVAINDAMFRIPFVGNWLYLLGLVPVHKYSIKKVLNRGDSVVVVVGGIDEVLLGTYDDKDVLYLQKRKGFVKLALENQAGLVPVFCFGENMLFSHSSEASLGFWRQINKVVKLGAPFPIQGRWGLPIMFRRPMLTVWGAPLFAKEGETVVEFHARYVEALEDLYAAHVGQSDDPKRKLVIV